MLEQRGFLTYAPEQGRITINSRETLSLVANYLLLEEILATRRYMKGRLLDVGCGKRPYSLIYEPLVEESIGTEVIFSPHGTNAANLISFAETLPFDAESFDTILCTEVLEHTRQPFQVVNEFSRVLKPNGYLLLSVPFIYPVHEEPHDYWRFTTYGLQELCQSAGLTVLYIHPKGGIGATLMTLNLNLVVRALNGISKVLRLPSSLRTWNSVRWFLSALQLIFLAFSKRWPSVLSSTRLTDWMTIGHFMVAYKPFEAMSEE